MQKFSEIKYERPNVKKLKRDFSAGIKEFKNASGFEQADAAFIKCNRIIEEAGTMYVVAEIRNTANMKDEFYDGEMKFYNKAIPMLMPMLKKAISALLDSPYRTQMEEKYGSQLFKSAEMQKKLLSPAIILPSVKENNLTTAYSKTAAGCSVEFKGEKCNFYGLLRHMQSVDREERKSAFNEWAKLYEGVSPALEEQYGKLVKLRCSIAKKLGYNSYIDYIYLSRGRYDYNSKDAAVFREAVRKYITPVCDKMFKEQAQRLGIEKLQWYDESLVFPDGNASPIGTPEELIKKANDMYADISPETEEFFGFMTQFELYDLVTRENKHLGGYCTMLPSYKAPFIFSNFNGTSADVDVLTHEAGHAFQAYYASRRLPIMLLSSSTSEINEIHSMTMEHFAYPYMDSFFGENADKYRYAHFCDALKTIPYLVSVDEFQHRVFENPKSGPADWRRFWKETEQKYMPWRNYDGNAFLESGGFWMQKQHIFLYPFYYIDYALAQLGAFSIYKKKTEGGNAWESYLTLCSLGGKYGYFETLRRAEIPLPLKEETVKAMAEFAEKHSEILKQKIK
ncbi:MAG: M3 family oligoendopeptidase [Oscillospiraceae bacterium]|nr:M3 family oligoendopeptidase [Oscillospiraceae bacterium]